MSVLSRLVLLGGAACCAACGPVVNQNTVVLVRVAADPQTGPATQAALTSEGDLFVVTTTRDCLELDLDGGAQTVVSPAMQRFVPNFKDAQTLAEGQGGAGLFVAKGHGFVAVDPAVPALTASSFANAGFSAVRGRDAQGAWWAASPPSFGQFDGKEFLAHLDPGASDWVIDEVPLADPAHTTFAAVPVMTSDARFFYRPAKAGVWEIDVANKQMVERVPCAHDFFGGACDGAVSLFAGRDGVLYLFSPQRELWRIGSRETTPTRVVKGAMPSLDATAAVLPVSFVVDPSNRVWVALTSAKNGGGATWLYEAEPTARDGWTLISNALPPSLVLFGNGALPVLSSTDQSTGLLVYRATLR